MEHSRSRAVRRRRIKRRSRIDPALAGAAIRGFACLLFIAVGVLVMRWALAQSPDQIGLGAPARIQPSAFSGTSLYGIQQRNRRLVYPYSVVPGGVRSGDELREIAAHDPVVAQHYSGFDYSRAHVIEVDHPRMVYVSYRRGGQIHWTSKQAMLRAGEKLLTDGRMTARTRCGNQVSVLPHTDTVPDEPTMAELERPDAVASGTEQLFPQSSTALHLDPLIPVGPPYASFPQPGGFMPLPLGGGPGGPVVGGCPSTKKKGEVTESQSSKDCNHTPPPPPTVPEPGTMVLFLSGAAAVFAEVRRRSRA